MHERVLIIDDDEIVLTFLERLLVKNGYRVLAATNGRQALDICRSNPVDLAVSDIFMPEQDGLETIMKIKREFPGIKIIAISGGGLRVPANYLPAAAVLGAHRVMKKPFEPDQILKAVHEVMEMDVCRESTH